MKKLLLIIFLLCWFAQAHAIDITLRWDTTGVTEYEVSMSTDGGATYGTVRLTGSSAPQYIWVSIPEDSLLMFKVASVEGDQKVYNENAGCWYDYRLLTEETFFPTIEVDGSTSCLVIWEAVVNATGYELLFSENKGTSWSTDIVLEDVLTYTWEASPRDRLIFIKGCASDGETTGCRAWSGSWYMANPGWCNSGKISGGTFTGGIHR